MIKATIDDIDETKYKLTISFLNLSNLPQQDNVKKVFKSCKQLFVELLHTDRWTEHEHNVAIHLMSFFNNLRGIK